LTAEKRWDDLPFVEVETSVLASAETVWDIVVDLDRWGSWSPEFQGGEWSPAGPVVGGSFVGHNKQGEREWSTTSVVKAAARGEVFEWEVQSGGSLPVSTWRIDIKPIDGGVLVKHSAQLGPGESGLTRALDKYPDRADEIKAGRAAFVKEGMEAVLAGLKGAAEAS
jgi:hypothetical protein